MACNYTRVEHATNFKHFIFQISNLLLQLEAATAAWPGRDHNHNFEIQNNKSKFKCNKLKFKTAPNLLASETSNTLRDLRATGIEFRNSPKVLQHVQMSAAKLQNRTSEPPKSNFRALQIEQAQI